MTECVLWDKSLTGPGYGQRWFRGKLWLAHRAAYVEAYGEIPEGHQVHHKCGVRRCVNAEHLVALLPRDHYKLSRREFCKRGHRLSETEYIKRSGARQCRTCLSLLQRLTR